ncbi:phospholipase C type enzyme [Emmonsiellopsis sp. PD_5]|nr:phospholipase C type enzyme [Emmonsiellopsis sp. PD_5]
MAVLFRDVAGIPRLTASTTDSALIIIDAQNEYANGLLKVDNVDSSRAVIKSLLEKYRATAKATGKQNVVHVVHKTPDGAPVFTTGTPLADEFEELKPLEGEKVITKLFPSSFAETDLHEYLQSLDVKKIVLVGYMAHVCVSTTARRGAELAYDIVIAEDGVGDRPLPGYSGDEITKVALLELADFFGTLVSSKDIN